MNKTLEKSQGFGIDEHRFVHRASMNIGGNNGLS
ncbi:hypothetical protein ig2599ANME_0162 [groundwater metagenome]